MKVAIASDDGRTIASHLGQVRGFIVLEIGPAQVRRRGYIENTFTGHARGLSGAGHGVDRHGPVLEALKGCKAAVAQGMGRRIHDDLRAAGIEAYIVDETDPDAARELGMHRSNLHRLAVRLGLRNSRGAPSVRRSRRQRDS